MKSFLNPFAVGFFVLLTSVLSFTNPALSQQSSMGLGQQPMPGQFPLIRAIEVRYVGPATISKERLLSNMRTSVGQPFNQQAVEDDIRALYATGEVTNVRIFSEPLPDGVKAVVIVQTRSLVKSIVINGNHRLSTRYIKKKIATKEGAVLNEETIAQDRLKILSLYEDRSYPEAIIDAHIDYNEQTGNAVIIFNIREGTHSSLHKVRFIGIQHASARELRHVMKNTRGKDIIFFFDKSGRLDPAKLQEDLLAVKEFYQNKGYIDVEITSTTTQRLPNGDVELIITVQEGVQYHVTKITFEGQQVLTEAQIRPFLTMKEGSLYTPKGLKEDVKTIGDFYGSRGYVEARVEPEDEVVGSNQVALHYHIEEGSPYYVEKINIQGNTITKDKVIRREIAVNPGEIDNTVLLDISKMRLDSLDYFEKIDITQTDTDIPGRKDINVLVEEKKTGSLTFGAGFSTIDSILGQIDLSQRNFDILNWHNFSGGGQKFHLSLQGGPARRDATVSLTEPYFFDTRFAVGGEAFYHDTDYSSYNYSESDAGFALNVRHAITRFTAGSLEYRLENIRISDVSDDSSILGRETGPSTRSAVRGGFSFDTRDNLFLTHRGARVDFSPYVAGGYLGGNTNIYGMSANASQYFSLPWDLILLFNGEAGTVDTLPDSVRVPVYDRLYLGGPSNMRGYGFRKVGPKDFNGVPVGGRSLARGTIELTFPILERVRGAIFSDIGFVNQKSWDFNPNVRLHSKSDFPHDPNQASDDPKIPLPNPSLNDLKWIEFGSGLAADAGIGLRMNLPAVGAIRLDYGFPITDDGYNFRKYGRFNINVGYQF